jgi:hypothetical protein
VSAVGRLAGEDAVKWITEPPPPGQDDNNGTRSPTGVNVDYDPQNGLDLHGPPYNLTGSGVIVGQWERTHTSQGHPDLIGRVTLGDVTKPFTSERAIRYSENVATNQLFDVGETIYRDNDDNLIVSQDDDRLSDWTGGNQVHGPGNVSATDDDIGTALSVAFIIDEKYVDSLPFFNSFQTGEAVYREVVNKTGVVDADDLRLTDVPCVLPGGAGGGPGSLVAPGHCDWNDPLILFPRVDPHEHSTQMAGTILGSGAASQGLQGSPNQWKGVAPGASLRT